ncbi:hypothetical protein P4B35_23725 [Pontiellaceae bacterium B12227]|nr:hypothetical protein [Pontiellaceae bacterium B12227]
MKKILILIFVVLFTLHTQATIQFGDILVVDGEKHSMSTYPLYEYLDYFASSKPDFGLYFNSRSTACYRGYIATWEISDGILYLIKIQDQDLKQTYPLNTLFPTTGTQPVKAEWFSGFLSLHKGKSIDHWGAKGERELLYRINSGDVAEKFIVDHKKRWITQASEVLEAWHPFGTNAPVCSFKNYEGTREDFSDNLNMMAELAMIGVDEGLLSSKIDLEPRLKFISEIDSTHFRLTENHRGMSCLQFLNAIAKETSNALVIDVKEGYVVFKITKKQVQKTSQKYVEGTENTNSTSWLLRKRTTPRDPNDIFGE